MINNIINLQERIPSELKPWKNKKSIDKSTYKSVKAVGSRPRISYGSGKIHEENCNGLNLFCPIFSAIGGSAYKLAKFLLKFLTPSAVNKYTVIHSFHFTEGICQQDPNLHMASLYVNSLFTNTPLDQTIGICVDNLNNGKENPTKISKHDFSSLINTATKE